MAIPADNIKKCVTILQVQYPMDLTAPCSRMMAYPYPSPYPHPSPTASIAKPSLVRVVREIALRDGYAGFSRGLGPCLLRAFPVNASAYFVYEGVMRLLDAEKVRPPLSHSIN